MGTGIERAELLSCLKKDFFDLLVIGGGATGCGIALEAASRGLSVALVEREDFASGTSSRSTKLVHGGVRYLEQAIHHLDSMQYNLVQDALGERSTFFHIAPFAVRRLAILTPIYRWHKIPYFWFGLKAYDWIAGKGGLGRSHFLPRKKALRRFPLLRGDGLKGAMIYYDGQFNDARMATLIALTAIEQGACCLNHCECVELSNGDATIVDRITGERFSVRAKQIVNATGPFTDLTRTLADPNCEPLLRPSAGTHVLLPPKYCPTRTGMLIPNTKDDRILFLLPWEGHAVAGTTDAPAEATLLPRASGEEVRFILDHLSDYFGEPIPDHDVLSVWSGLRPLISSKKSSAKASRDHLIHRDPSGLITITGGKWTTYRRMAEELVDELNPPKPSRTRTLCLIGTSPDHRNLSLQLQKRYALSHDVASHLVRSYGSRAEQLLEEAPDLEQIVEGHPYLRAEVPFVCRNELACTVSDLLARRTRLAFLDLNRARKAMPVLLDLMAKECGWDATRIEKERSAAEELLATMEPDHGLHT